MKRSSDPSVSKPAGELASFVHQVNGAVGQVGEFLRATANPVQLTTTARPGRAWVLSAQVQAYAYALALAFVAMILGAATITAERDERTLGRLVQGLASLGQLDRADEARTVLAELERFNPIDAARYWQATSPYADPAHRAHLDEGLRKAGMKI